MYINDVILDYMLCAEGIRQAIGKREGGEQDRSIQRSPSNQRQNNDSYAVLPSDLNEHHPEGQESSQGSSKD